MISPGLQQQCCRLAEFLRTTRRICGVLKGEGHEKVNGRSREGHLVDSANYLRMISGERYYMTVSQIALPVSGGHSLSELTIGVLILKKKNWPLKLCVCVCFCMCAGVCVCVC